MKQPTLEQLFEKVKPGDFGVIGDPVAHSLSPAMHNAALHEWWQSQGRPLDPAPHYHKFHVEKSVLKEFLTAAREKGLHGLNVTVPHKESVLGFLDAVDPFAKDVRAVNTIHFENNRARGFNTDADGFQLSLTRDLGYDPANKPAFVLGAGATGVVLAHRLIELKASTVYLWNRGVDRAREVLSTYPKLKSRLRLAVTAYEIEEAAAKSELIVNATSVGLKTTDGIAVPHLDFEKHHFVFDVIYHRDTAFMKAARAAGAQVTGGLDMLLYQGAKAFEIWTGSPAPIEIMRAELVRAMKKG